MGRGLNWYDQGARFYMADIPRTPTPDPHAENYYPWSPYSMFGNNPLLNIDPDGRDWYSYEEEEDENGKKTRTGYKYVEGQMSKEKMKEGGYTHLDKTFTNGNDYYSLFGSTKKLNTLEGKIYQLMDKAIMNEADTKIEAMKTRVGETAYTNFAIEGIDAKDTRMLGIDSHRNEYPIEYEGSFIGVYRIYDGKGMMIGQQEEWIGRSDMPKQIGDWKVSKPAYHIIYRNKGGSDIIHLKYNKDNAQKMIQNYYKLYPQLKK